LTLYDALSAEHHYEKNCAEDASGDLIDAIVTESGKFEEKVLSPLHLDIDN